jgi:hypothetical protein
VLFKTEREVKLRAILLIIGAQIDAICSELAKLVFWGIYIIEPG